MLHTQRITLTKVSTGGPGPGDGGPKLIIDFTGTGPQAKGPINHCGDYVGGNFLKKWLAPILRNLADTPERMAELDVNEGIVPLIEMKFPEKGTLLTPIYPAPTNARTFVILRLLGVLAGVVAKAVDGKMPADQETIRYTGVYGKDRDGNDYLMREVLGGGSGGRYYADGEDTIHVVPDSRNLPTEFTESRFPFIVERLGLAVDSGGAGRYRGGLGYEKHIRMLKDAHFMSIADRSILACWGVKGGKAGRPFEVTVDVGGPEERTVDALADAEVVKAGQVIRIRTTGGGGWGDPLDRPYDEVERDLRWGKVSFDGARRDYGVVATGDIDGPVIDTDASDALREQLRADRAAEQPFFDRGPGYATLAGGTDCGRCRLGLTVTTVLVIGATGKTGRAVTRALASREVDVRAAVRSTEAGKRAYAAGARSISVVDLESGVGLDEALAGVDAVYHLAPNVHPDEVGIAERVAAAAERAGLSRFVFHSVLHPDDASMPHHLRKAEAERVIRDHLPGVTVLRPAAYHQNLVDAAVSGRLTVPYSLDAPFTNVDLADVAEVAATVLTRIGHEGLTYDLAGPEVLSVRDLARVATDVLGRPVAGHPRRGRRSGWPDPARPCRPRPATTSWRCSRPTTGAASSATRRRCVACSGTSRGRGRRCWLSPDVQPRRGASVDVELLDGLTHRVGRRVRAVGALLARDDALVLRALRPVPDEQAAGHHEDDSDGGQADGGRVGADRKGQDGPDDGEQDSDSHVCPPLGSTEARRTAPEDIISPRPADRNGPCEIDGLAPRRRCSSPRTPARRHTSANVRGRLGQEVPTRPLRRAP